MGALAMKRKDAGIDQSEVISGKRVEKIVESHRKHGQFVTYDDVSKKELQAEGRTITRRIRNANDKRVWNIITGDREWAWKVITVCCAMMSNGLGFGISQMVRNGKGHEGNITRGAVWLATFAQWREEAVKRKLNPDMCIEVLWGGLSLRAAETKYNRARHAARKNLIACLDLLVEMRDTPRGVHLRAWRAAGLIRAEEAGIEVTEETLKMGWPLR